MIIIFLVVEVMILNKYTLCFQLSKKLSIKSCPLKTVYQNSKILSIILSVTEILKYLNYINTAKICNLFLSLGVKSNPNWNIHNSIMKLYLKKIFILIKNKPLNLKQYNLEPVLILYSSWCSLPIWNFPNLVNQVP